MPSNEKSGVAIRARASESDVANYHFFDSLARAQRLTGRIIVDLIPGVIDTPRAIRILGKDMQPKVVKVNQEHADPQTGKLKLYDMKSVACYDVVTQSGPSYTTKREQAGDLLMRLVQANPLIAQQAADLIARFMDLPQEVVERLRRTIPPQLLEDPNNPDGPPPQVLQQQLQQSQAMVQQLDAVIQKMLAEIQTLETQVKDKVMTAQLKHEDTIIKGKVELQKQAMQNAHDAGMANMEHVHTIVQGDAEAQRQPNTVIADNPKNEILPARNEAGLIASTRKVAEQVAPLRDTSHEGPYAPPGAFPGYSQ
jgi:hypothetical protein